MVIQRIKKNKYVVEKNIRYIEELNMDRVSPQNIHFQTRSSLKNKCMEGRTSCLRVWEQVTNACLQRGCPVVPSEGGGHRGRTQKGVCRSKQVRT